MIVVIVCVVRLLFGVRALAMRLFAVWFVSSVVCCLCVLLVCRCCILVLLCVVIVCVAGINVRVVFVLL